MDSWKVVKYGDAFAVQTPDPNPESTDIYNEPGPLICRQDKAGIYGCELSEKEAHLIAAAPEMLEALKAFLRAPSVGSDGPGSSTIVVQDFNRQAAQAAIGKAEGNES